MTKTRITAVCENTVLHWNWLAQHGQSLLIEHAGQRHLFDSAEDYKALLHNLAILGLKLSDIDSFAFSHKHVDHAGSLPQIIDELTTQPVYVLPDFGTTDLRQPGSTYKAFKPEPDGRINVAVSEQEAAIIKNYPHAVLVKNGLQLGNGLFLTGPVGGEITEQAMIIRIPEKGLVVLVGCAHPTLPAMIERAQSVTGEDRIYGLVGGFHLKDMSADDITLNVAFLKTLDLKFVVPSHCTGYQAIRKMQEVLQERVVVSETGQFGTGNSITLEPDPTLGPA
jgi:7,8-dihydropterin-6-yl-methyl-4-(beta-D-ribofuranosyl)aminobenzene 5'-phosphate synthase